MGRGVRSSFKRGFTVIELLIVIVIIGILATVIFVAYNGITSRAADNSVLSDLDGMDGVQTQYGLQHSSAGKAWYSGDGLDTDLNFTPSDGNVVDVVINDDDYCIRIYNVRSASYKRLEDAAEKESTDGACGTLAASPDAVANAPQAPDAPITYIASTYTNGNTATIPSHQVGDLIVIIAARSGSNTPPTIDPSFTTLDASLGGSGSAAGAIGYKIAASNSEVSGTWANANAMTAAVYRNVDATTPIPVRSKNANWAGAINYPALTLTVTDSSSRVVAYGFHRSATASFASAPGATSTRLTYTNGSTIGVGLYDTNVGVASWSSTNQSVSGTSNAYFSVVFELKAANP